MALCAACADSLTALRDLADNFGATLLRCQDDTNSHRLAKLILAHAVVPADAYVTCLLSDYDWRYHLVASVILVAERSDVRPAKPLIWARALEGSFVGPQLVAIAHRIDPAFGARAAREGASKSCPEKVRGAFDTLVGLQYAIRDEADYRVGQQAAKGWTLRIERAVAQSEEVSDVDVANER